jgi:Ca2+-transporting ATPase
MGYDYRKLRTPEKLIKVFPFCSYKKKMATIYAEDRRTTYVFVKGAPDLLMESCNKFINLNGSIIPINQHFKDEFNSILRIFGNDSLRTLLLAYKEAT